MKTYKNLTFSGYIGKTNPFGEGYWRPQEFEVTGSNFKQIFEKIKAEANEDTLVYLQEVEDLAKRKYGNKLSEKAYLDIFDSIEAVSLNDTLGSMLFEENIYLRTLKKDGVVSVWNAEAETTEEAIWEREEI